ncbi:MAG: Cephalosporin hydroxylase [Cyanobacteria bacterium RYN_339]|nr:Cephalosporin hydroxylase [Cyanobacteria bacterium RYN_339]
MSSQADDMQLQAAAIARMGEDAGLNDLSRRWFRHSAEHKYSYNFSWMGRPIIQYPQDIVAMQELVWQVQPDLIVETGIAHGGSLVLYASFLKLMGEGRVLGIDIDIRAHNRAAIEAHPMADRIDMIEGSSIDEAVVARVFEAARGKRVLLVLDSNHTHEHVLRELALYTPLVKAGSYAVVFDTVVEWMPAEAFPDRPWGPGNNPMTAVEAFLKTTDRFEVDTQMDAKLQISVAPKGFLRCIAD